MKGTPLKKGKVFEFQNRIHLNGSKEPKKEAEDKDAHCPFNWWQNS